MITSVWILTHETGEYSDWNLTVVGVFSDLANAEFVRERLFSKTELDRDGESEYDRCGVEEFCVNQGIAELRQGLLPFSVEHGESRWQRQDTRPAGINTDWPHDTLVWARDAADAEEKARRIEDRGATEV